MRSPKEKKKPDRWFSAILTGVFFSLSPLAYLAESEPGLAGYKTDSLGRMADSEASNEGFYVHKFIKRYQFNSLSLPSRYLLLLNMAFGIIIIAALFKSQFLFNLCLFVLQPPLGIYHLNRLLSVKSTYGQYVMT